MKAIVPGPAAGEVVTLDEPLSLWGGYDPESGLIVDGAHPQFGLSLSRKIVVMAHGRGSSSSSSVLAESLRLGTGPAALVLAEPDQILVVGSLVARLLYGKVCPVYVGDPGAVTGTYVELNAGEESLGEP